MPRDVRIAEEVIANQISTWGYIFPSPTMPSMTVFAGIQLYSQILLTNIKIYNYEWFI